MASGEKLHLLLVEDNHDHAEMILRHVSRTGRRIDAEHAATLAAGLAAIARRPWHAVLLDLQLPDSNGLETLAAMVRQAVDVPVVVLTSLGDEELGTAALQQGAQDYLVKDALTGEVLARTIRYAIERKRIEERLKVSLAELARRAHELEQLNARLEEQNSELGNFNHMISHDLREPIRHLMLFSQRLRSSAGHELSAKADRDLQLVFAAAQRMEGSVSGLQMLSLASQGEIRRARVSLDFCVHEAIADLEQPISEREAVVSFGTLPEVEADPALLTLLFRNLISNALKYCSSQPLIQVTTDHNGPQWVFGVRDNGIGIDPLYGDRIFAPFQRLHGREEYGGGSGLGLAICQKIVAGHGGRIWVDSQLGQGAHFLFTLCPELNGLEAAHDDSTSVALA
jgi:signal transduction histidine kinase